MPGVEDARKWTIRVQLPPGGIPGYTVALCSDTYVSGFEPPAAPCSGLLLNVATVPGVPTNPPEGTTVAVTGLPSTSDPAPAGEFSTGAATRFPAVSTQAVAPTGSASWNRKLGFIASSSATNGLGSVNWLSPTCASTPTVFPVP